MNKPSNRKPVGVIGGMGPEATALLMTRIIRFTPAHDDSDHVPLFIDNNTQVPSRIKALIENTGDDPGPVLQKMAQQLEALGAQALAMPCNTAHVYSNQISRAVKVPLLNMVELSAAAIARRGSRINVGILGSPAIMKLELFDNVFASLGIAGHYPQDQTLMLSAIKAIKSGRDEQSARSILANASRELRHNGADILLIACSEFSIINDAIPSDMEFIDTIDVLARAVVEFSCNS